MRFNVVIATYRRPELLERTLRSLAAARKPPGFERVIVVENGAPDGALAICQGMGSSLALEYRHHTQPGKGRAVQWVLEQLRTGFVLFLDDDVRVHEDLLEMYFDSVQKFGRGYFFGGPVDIDYEREPAAWLKRHMPFSARGWSVTNPETPLHRSCRFLGANFGAFAEDVLAVGGFMPQFGPGALHSGTEGNPTGLELELQDRLIDRGYAAIYVADARIWHFVPTQRCSEGWAVHRVFRNEFSRVLRIDAATRSRHWRVGKVPVRVWVRFIQRAMHAMVAPLLSDAEQRFQLKAQFSEMQGRVHGYRSAGSR